MHVSIYVCIMCPICFEAPYYPPRQPREPGAAGREGSNQDREGFIWRPGMEKCTEARSVLMLGPNKFWDFGIEKEYYGIFETSFHYYIFRIFFGILHSFIFINLYLSIGGNLQAPNQITQANSCLRLDKPKQKRYPGDPTRVAFRFFLCSHVAGHLVLVRSLCLQSGWRGGGFTKPLICHVARSKQRQKAIQSYDTWWCYQWIVHASSCFMDCFNPWKFAGYLPYF